MDCRRLPLHGWMVGSAGSGFWSPCRHLDVMTYTIRAWFKLCLFSRLANAHYRMVPISWQDVTYPDNWLSRSSLSECVISKRVTVWWELKVSSCTYTFSIFALLFIPGYCQTGSIVLHYIKKRCSIPSVQPCTVKFQSWWINHQHASK